MDTQIQKIEMEKRARLDPTKIFDLKRIASMQASFRKRLSHTVVFMDRDAHVLIDETGIVPTREGQRPHPCQHCSIILEASGAEFCHQSDKEAADIAAIINKPLLYRCWTLKSNVAIPITVGEMDVIGNLYAGQFFAVVDNDEERDLVSRECIDRGLMLHDGKRPNDGLPTEWIRPGFFWTREEIETYADKQLDFCKKAKVNDKNRTSLEESWIKVQRIPYKDALESVYLLMSIANTFATEAYEKLAYRLNHDIKVASEKVLSKFKNRTSDVNRWIRMADNLIDKLVSKEKGVAGVTEQLAALYIEVLTCSVGDRSDAIIKKLDSKRDFAEWSGGGEKVDRLEEEIDLIRREIEEFQRERPTYISTSRSSR